MPAPSPSTVFADPYPAEVLDDAGQLVWVSGRGVVSASPAQFRLMSGGEASGWRPGRTRHIAAWAGPWPIDERWWEPEGHQRLARFQMIIEDRSRGPTRLSHCGRTSPMVGRCPLRLIQVMTVSVVCRIVDGVGSEVSGNADGVRVSVTARNLAGPMTSLARRKPTPRTVWITFVAGAALSSLRRRFDRCTSTTWLSPTHRGPPDGSRVALRESTLRWVDGRAVQARRTRCEWSVPLRRRRGLRVGQGPW